MCRCAWACKHSCEGVSECFARMSACEFASVNVRERERERERERGRKFEKDWRNIKIETDGGELIRQRWAREEGWRKGGVERRK